MKADKFLKLLEEYRISADELLSAGILKKIYKDMDEHDFMEDYQDAFASYTEGGKRLRAFMVILGYNICGSKKDDDIVLASLSYELFQSGVLIHDDIIDESSLRRNKPAMHIMLGKDDKKRGTARAICVGDNGIIGASDAILLSGFDSDKKVRAIESLNRTFKLTIAGEIKDIDLSGDADYSLEDVIGMYRLKTSRYTFIGPMQLGMILGGADDKLLNDAERLGDFMGTAFQIRDDILGIFGTEDATGKSSVSDIEEGKKTVLTCFFKDNASEEQKRIFEENYGTGNCDENMSNTVRRLLDETGARAFAEKLCREYTDRAVSVIDEMELDEGYKEVLLGMMEYLNERVG